MTSTSSRLETASGLPEMLPGLLVTAAVTQWLLYRVFSRIGIYLPLDGPAARAYGMLVEAGLVAMDVAMGLALLTGIALLWRWYSHEGRLRLADLGLVVLLLGTLMATVRVGLDPTSLDGLLKYNVISLLSLLAILGGVAVNSRHWAQRFVILCVAVAYSGSYYYAISNNLAQLGHWPGAASHALPAQAAGQMAALLNGLPVLLAYGLSPFSLVQAEPRRQASAREWIVVVLPVAVSLMWMLAYARTPYLTAILVNWGLGLNMNLPVLLYTMSLWGFALAVCRCLVSGGVSRYWGYGLILIFLAGLAMPLTLDPLLAGIGSWLLGRGGEAACGLAQTQTERHSELMKISNQAHTYP